jgi:hypothetical protein
MLSCQKGRLALIVNRAPISNVPTFLDGSKNIHPSLYIGQQVYLRRSSARNISSFAAKISAMFRQNGSPEDQRIKAEMEARNARAIDARFRGSGPQDVEERVRK